MSPTLAELKRLVEDAELSPPERSVAAWTAAAQLGSESDLAQSADGAYLAGYAYYQLGAVSADYLERSAKLLRCALLTDPFNIYARLYLGHLAYDKGNFSEALGHFDELAPDAFAQRAQAWRDLKRQELRICCLLQLGQVATLVHEFEQLLQLASGMDDTDTLAVQELPTLLQSAFGSRSHAA